MTYTVLRADDQRDGLPGDQHRKRGPYTLVTDYFTDPTATAVVWHAARFAARGPHDLKLYVRFDATINGNGGGGPSNGGRGQRGHRHHHRRPVGFDTDTATNAANRDYAVPVYAALRADRPFLGREQRLRRHLQRRAGPARRRPPAGHHLRQAPDGNVVQTAQLDVGDGRPATLALGFGAHPGRARSTPPASRPRNFDGTLNRVRSGAGRLRQAAEPAAAARPGCPAQRRPTAGVGVLPVGQRAEGQRGQDLPRRRRRLPGQPLGAGGQRGRPGGKTLLRLLPRGVRPRPVRDVHRAVASGDSATARDTVRFLFERQQQADGSMPRNSLRQRQDRAGHRSASSSTRWPTRS